MACTGVLAAFPARLHPALAEEDGVLLPASQFRGGGPGPDAGKGYPSGSVAVGTDHRSVSTFGGWPREKGQAAFRERI